MSAKVASRYLVVVVGLAATAACGSSKGTSGTGGGTAGNGPAGSGGVGGGIHGTGGLAAGGHGGGPPSGTAGDTGSTGTGGSGLGGAGGLIGGKLGTTQCSDGIDNDGDGKIDLMDPECVSPLDNDESSFATGIPGDN